MKRPLQQYNYHVDRSDCPGLCNFDIHLDEPLQNFLPDFSVKNRFPDAGPVTPRTLLTHHSGLPSMWFKGVWSRSPVPFTELVKEIRDESPCYPPNYVYSYSGLGMTLLGHMVEAVSGRDFIAYMDEFMPQWRLHREKLNQAPLGYVEWGY